MAKRRRAATAQVVKYLPAPTRQPAQVIQIRSPAPRSPARTSSRKAPKRRSSKSHGRQLSPIQGAIGGAVYGFLEKQFPNFPTIPMLGRSGTIAVVGHFLLKKNPNAGGGILRDVVFASAVIAGHELGRDGKISGDDDVGSIPSQVRGGLASQV